VNGRFVGSAKTHGRDGKALAPMHEGILGADEYYVSAPTRQPRFTLRLTGWIRKNEFIGRAYAIF
jgi:type IV secretory pathway protease TraF